MLKIIDVPEKTQICVYDEDGNMIREDKVKYLPDYTPEPLTADRLTLREFAKKLDEGKHAEWNLGKWREPIQSNEGMLLHLLSTPEDMQYYRLKPEVVHYFDDKMNALCNSSIKTGRTNIKRDVTCPDCIAAMSPKYKPWYFDTAPKSFVDENNNEWFIMHTMEGSEWYFVCPKRKSYSNFIDLFNENKQIDGSPCGVKI